MSDDFADDLSAWLNAISESSAVESAAARAGDPEWSRGRPARDRYVVERTLKEAPGEITQIVRRRGQDDQTGAGPFVRKIFSDASLGAAYRQLLDAQTSGRRFSHLPLVYECERIDDTFEVVMELVRGETLKEYVARVGAGPWVAELVIPQLCDALGELHEGMSQPVIHRDVKPSNIVVGDGRVTLIDLGIARAWHDDATRDTVRYGTPGYAPPEQYGFGQTGVRSDVYAAGMTLAYCLLGDELLATGDPSRLVERGFADPRIPAPLREVLATATSFDPARRYGSAHELREAFAQATGVDAAKPPRRLAGPPAFLGRLWNTLVVLVWALFLAALFDGVVHPIESLANAPLWLLIVMYLGVFAIPLTCAAYALLDKRRIPHPPWRSWLPLCVEIAFASFALAAMLYLVFY